ncbi:MAG: DUF2442 domain-containing protein [Deltaproteobacteria bacterium]|nr:DUF2442 domain-containing protein [Deltaproteobacteria bacterium]
MKSEALGIDISPAVEVTNVSRHGIWLFAGGREIFLSHAEFPWFKTAPIEKVLNVAEAPPGHFFWPELDIDLTDQMIEHPERYPLTARPRPPC